MKRLWFGLLCLALVGLLMIPIGQLLLPPVVINGLTIARSELNGLSLQNIFIDNAQSMGYSSVNYNPDFTLGTGGWAGTGSSLTANNGIATFLANSQNDTVYQYLTEGVIAANSVVYTAAKISTNRANVINTDVSSVVSPYHTGDNAYQTLTAINTSSAYDLINIKDIGASAWTNVLVDYFYVFDVNTYIGWKLYSPYYNTTFDLMSNAQRKYQLDLWVLEGLDTMNPYFTYQSVGLGSILSETQKLYWYNLYLTLI